jgi:hypothetical protein
MHKCREKEARGDDPGSGGTFGFIERQEALERSRRDDLEFRMGKVCVCVYVFLCVCMSVCMYVCVFMWEILYVIVMVVMVVMVLIR